MLGLKQQLASPDPPTWLSAISPMSARITSTGHSNDASGSGSSLHVRDLYSACTCSRWRGDSRSYSFAISAVIGGGNVDRDTVGERARMGHTTKSAVSKRDAYERPSDSTSATSQAAHPTSGSTNEVERSRNPCRRKRRTRRQNDVPASPHELLRACGNRSHATRVRHAVSGQGRADSGCGRVRIPRVVRELNGRSCGDIPIPCPHFAPTAGTREPGGILPGSSRNERRGRGGVPRNEHRRNRTAADQVGHLSPPGERTPPWGVQR